MATSGTLPASMPKLFWKRCLRCHRSGSLHGSAIGIAIHFAVRREMGNCTGAYLRQRRRRFWIETSGDSLIVWKSNKTVTALGNPTTWFACGAIYPIIPSNTITLVPELSAGAAAWRYFQQAMKKMVACLWMVVSFCLRWWRLLSSSQEV